MQTFAALRNAFGVRGYRNGRPSSLSRGLRRPTLTLRDMQPQILSPEDSAFWRQAYIDRFIDTVDEHYQRYIAFTRQFSDGIHYEGYLWDCLRSRSRITVQRFR